MAAKTTAGKAGGGTEAQRDRARPAVLCEAMHKASGPGRQNVDGQICMKPMKETDCPRCRELYEKVQNQLRTLGELIHAEREAVANKSENLWLALDRQLEEEFGAKERAMGALSDHMHHHD